jgi:hypothetical protein
MAEDKKSEVQIPDRVFFIYEEKSLARVWTLCRSRFLSVEELLKIKAAYEEYRRLIGNDERFRRDQPVLKEIYVSLPCLREHAEELRQKLQQILSEG